MQAFAADLARSLDSSEVRKITKAQAEEAKKIANREIVRDLGGDRKFRNWAPTADLQVRMTRNDGAMMSPTRTGAGIITTVNQGRNQGNASGFSGPGVNTRTGLTSRTKSGGLRRVRARSGKRWTGYTTGKGTADRAVRVIEAELPKVAQAEYHRVLSKRFDVTGR